ncbi:MAG: DUF11 domain-containing protein, partial [Acidobacteria bacterium ACB2]|nr:DUF11 domain-containing protein [Acidobacteria bacterium ACB2]
VCWTCAASGTGRPGSSGGDGGLGGDGGPVDVGAACVVEGVGVSASGVTGGNGGSAGASGKNGCIVISPEECMVNRPGIAGVNGGAGGDGGDGSTTRVSAATISGGWSSVTGGRGGDGGWGGATSCSPFFPMETCPPAGQGGKGGDGGGGGHVQVVAVDPATYSLTYLSGGSGGIGGPNYGPGAGLGPSGSAGMDGRRSSTTLPADGLTVEASVDHAWAHRGQLLTYTLRVATGQAPQTSAVLSDTLPEGVSFVSASSGSSLDGRTVSWSLGTVAPCSILSLTIVAAVGPDTPTGTRLLDVAVLASDAHPGGVTSDAAVTTVADTDPRRSGNLLGPRQDVPFAQEPVHPGTGRSSGSRRRACPSSSRRRTTRRPRAPAARSASAGPTPTTSR